VNEPADTPPMPAYHAAPSDVRTARLLVTGQFVLIGFLVLLPHRRDWSVPATLSIALSAGSVVGVLLMVIGATGLGRGLTATPLPNAHAQLRTGGLYRFVRHPIYSGLLLTMTSFTAASGSMLRLLTLCALFVLLTAKARWEERRLAQRFEGYAEYAARTPRFVPVRWRRRG
jgi:protein-S-isoprenylcysteine O-methyltransferase Ste14